MGADDKNLGREEHPLLRVCNVSLQYRGRGIFGPKGVATLALQGVSLDVFAGKTVALAGPSGSGKSSLARCILRLEQPTAGQILYKDENVLTLSREALKEVRKAIHLIFQDSASALNPGLNIEEILMEPILIHRTSVSMKNSQERIRDLMDQVELPFQWMGRRPYELSGGQRQRVAIARALMLQPKILILDEALSALDLSAQTQIVNLLINLQTQHSLGYLFITHDFSLAALLSDEAVVMDAGRIVRRGSTPDVFSQNPDTVPYSSGTSSLSAHTASATLSAADK
jgi:ABC-type glutathione transport system ATPase component